MRSPSSYPSHSFFLLHRKQKWKEKNTETKTQTEREREKAEETGRRTGAREIERGGDAEAHGAFSFGCGRLGGTDTIVFQYIWLRTLATPKKNIGNA